MRVSLVVPTYRRAEALRLCLAALSAQTTLPDEVLVVARRDDNASRRCVESCRWDRVKLLTIDVPPKSPGFVAALNAGVLASRGEIVCFTDDDSEARPEWLSLVLATFASDPAIGAVGGRDWVYHGDQLEDGAESVVGTVSWWGRVIGRHHLGVGPARNVSVLKGVNLSVQGSLVRSIGFDTRLHGITTEHHSELGLCLKLLRMGYRVVYDPAIAVDHRPRPRAAETRVFLPRQARDAAHNETLALSEHLSRIGVVTHLLYSALVGSSASPGIARVVWTSARERKLEWRSLVGNVGGRIQALTTAVRTVRRGPS